LILGISAYWDRTIRVLHVFEALPYAAAAVLVLRRNKLGYMLGAVGGAFWLWTAGLLTTFIRNGFERAAMLLRTGTSIVPISSSQRRLRAAPPVSFFSQFGVFVRSKQIMERLRFICRDNRCGGGLFRRELCRLCPQYLAQFRPIFGK